MPNIDHDKISQIIRDVAADKIVPRFRQLAQSEIRTKSGPTDFVTIADEEAEIELTRILTDLYPGSYVLGEEAVSSGGTLRDILNADAPVWIVDPVDGTSNFAHGNPIFGTMVSLVEKGARVGGWIYQIPRERMVVAQKGAGVTVDGARFTSPQKPADDISLKDMSAFIGVKFIPPQIRPQVEERIAQIGKSSTCTCCAWEYVDILEGKRTFSVYKRIEPWDHFAGALILDEAGYYVRKWDGSPYTSTDLEGGLINAPSQVIWERVYEAILKEPLAAMRS